MSISYCIWVQHILMLYWHNETYSELLKQKIVRRLWVRDDAHLLIWNKKSFKNFFSSKFGIYQRFSYRKKWASLKTWTSFWMRNFCFCWIKMWKLDTLLEGNSNPEKIYKIYYCCIEDWADISHLILKPHLNKKLWNLYVLPAVEHNLNAT